jgi:ketosteroid isomerase-like protein
MSVWSPSSLLALAVAASTQPAPDLAEEALSYIAAQEAVMERSASPQDADALVRFYAPDYTYYHPQFGAKVTGLDAVRNGIVSHYGETADAQILVTGMLVSGNMVSLALRERFIDIATGKTIDRPRMTVLTFRDGKIVQRVDM